jgi:hypothetical protein
MNNTNTGSNLTLDSALASLPKDFRQRLLKAYRGLKVAILEGNFDTCGLRVGRFCEVVLRFLQHELTGTFVPFGSKIQNFKLAAEALEQAPAGKAPEGLRILVPRALAFLYTLRNKRGIGHEGGDVDANETDASVAARLADWCVCEIVRVYHALSLEEAQALCDAITTRQLPEVWNVFGKKRVLDTSLSYGEQTLLLLYSDPDVAVAVEDLIAWTEHSNPTVFRRDVLSRLHSERAIEWDRETQMVVIGPKGVRRVEESLLGRQREASNPRPEADRKRIMKGPGRRT